MSNEPDSEPRMDRARLEFDRQRHADEQALAAARLQLEKARVDNETRLLSKHFGAVATALVSAAAIVVSLTQLKVTSIAKDRELELSDRADREQRAIIELQSTREWNIKAAEFIAAHESLVFSADTEKKRLFADLLLAAFPPEVTTLVVQRLLQAERTAEGRSVWAATGSTATGLSLGRLEGVEGSDTSAWMNSGAYVREFMRQRDLGNYPARVYARTQDRLEQFRADFVPTPPGVSWQSYHWMTTDEYNQRNAALIAQGFELQSSGEFMDATGTPRTVATWVRKE